MSFFCPKRSTPRLGGQGDAGWYDESTQSGQARSRAGAFVFCSVSWVDFSGQLSEEGHIAVEFLRQTTDYRSGRHHLAVDHLKQLHRVDAQLSAQTEDVGAPGLAQIRDVLAELTNFSALAFRVSMKAALKTIRELLVNQSFVASPSIRE
jgi:hypothetical protein